MLLEVVLVNFNELITKDDSDYYNHNSDVTMMCFILNWQDVNCLQQQPAGKNNVRVICTV